MIQRDEIYDGDRDFTKASYGDYDGDGEIVGYAETVWGIVLRLFLINPTWTAVAYSADGPQLGMCILGIVKKGWVHGPNASRCAGWTWLLLWLCLMHWYRLTEPA